MSPTMTPVRLSAAGAEATEPTDVLIVGAGLGTGVWGLWHHVATALAGQYQVIGWDLPGHDDAEPYTEPLTIADLADGVAELVRSLRGNGTIQAEAKVYYAGVSVNGEVALQLALDHADLFDGIAVICSAAKIGEQQAWQERADLVATAGTPTQVVGSASRWFTEGFIAANPTDSTNLLHTLQDADRFSYARICEALGGFDVRDRLGEITVPILSIQGADDQVCTVEDGQFIVDNVADPATARAVVVDGAAHQVPVEKPQRTAEILADFFQ